MIKKQSLQRITVYVTDTSWQELENIAQKYEIKKSQVLRNAINEYIKRERRKVA